MFLKFRLTILYVLFIEMYCLIRLIVFNEWKTVEMKLS